MQAWRQACRMTLWDSQRVHHPPHSCHNICQVEHDLMKNKIGVNQGFWPLHILHAGKAL